LPVSRPGSFRVTADTPNINAARGTSTSWKMNMLTIPSQKLQAANRLVIWS